MSGRAGLWWVACRLHVPYSCLGRLEYGAEGNMARGIQGHARDVQGKASEIQEHARDVQGRAREIQERLASVVAGRQRAARERAQSVSKDRRRQSDDRIP